MIPRTGILKTCDFLDTVGWFARCVKDSKTLLHSLGVKGDNYPVLQKAITKNKIEYAEKQTLIISSLRAPGCENINLKINEQVDDLLMSLSNKPNVEVRSTNLSQLLQDAHEIHDVIYSKYLDYYFQRELAETSLISPIFSEIVDKAKRITQTQYIEALDKQAHLTSLISTHFQEVDFMLVPSVADQAPQIGSLEPQDPSLIWTLLGIPVMT